ncbi:MAG TPA: DsbA family oxidoreductase [Flavobacterium sp.]|jgi:predicted DsbA family dithiol-disulfide isomerase
MKIEIWSDIMCPFCYIGKRKFEQALAQFSNREKVKIEWKSYQLSPDLRTDPDKNTHQFLAEHKGINIAEARQLNEQVAQMAAQVGLHYDFDRSVVANSFNAHRFAHLAKSHNKQDVTEELLFRSYFTDGKNINDLETLIQLGSEIGLEETVVRRALENDEYADEVYADIAEAQEIGVRGVPFFVFNRKYAVSGAQDPAVFLQTMEKAFVG